MPSIVVLDTDVTHVDPQIEREMRVRAGMVHLGMIFDGYYQDNVLIPLQVLHSTFFSILDPTNNPSGRYLAQFEIYDAGQNQVYDLEYRGVRPAKNQIVFRYEVTVTFPDGTTSQVKKRVLVRPQIDGRDPEDSKRYVMHALFPEDRYSSLGANGYVRGVAEDIVQIEDDVDLDAAAAYTLGTISFRRCL